MKLVGVWRIAFLGLVIIGWTRGAEAAQVKKLDRRLPDVYESAGGISVGLGNSGVAGNPDLSSIQINPALLALTKQYSLTGAYNWPTMGRNFYQAGAIDSVTSDVAAGASYTGFEDKLEKDPILRRKDREAMLKTRMGLAFAKAFKTVAFGVSGQYFEGYEENEDNPSELKTIKGPAFGLGVAGLISPTMRFGFSAENLGNRKVKNFAPKTYRGGLAYLALAGQVTLGLDYRQRERLDSAEGVVAQSVGQSGEQLDDTEKMVVGSFLVKAYDVLRLMGAYGQAISNDDRRTLAGGVGLVHKGFTLYYLTSRPYLDYKNTHSSISLSVLMAM